MRREGAEDSAQSQGRNHVAGAGRGQSTQILTPRKPCWSLRPTPTHPPLPHHVSTSREKQVDQQTVTLVYLSEGLCPLQNAWWPLALREDEG